MRHDRPTSVSPSVSGQPGDRLAVVVAIAMAGCAILFTAWPALDLAVSALFFDPATGFSGEQNAVALALYRGVPIFSRVLILGLFVGLVVYALRRGKDARRRRMQLAYLVTVLVLGPGLLIDVALKDYWGRARPYKVEAFGGPSQFTPALVPSDQCDNNCSFVSGHASAGFFLVSAGFLGGALARRRWTLIGLATGAVFGLGRIAQGGHFLSDVVFSFFATWIAAWLVWRVFRRMGWLADTDKPSPQAMRADAAGTTLRY